MKRIVHHYFVAAILLCSAAIAGAQVPRLVKFSGTISDTAGKPLTGTVGVTFSLYEEQHGGSPVWVEVQNVQALGNGQYTALLGSTRNEGIPAEVFGTGQRWLGVTVQGQAERPRVLMTSVPYSLKAADAETLGGLPASAYALAGWTNRGSVVEAVAGPAKTVPAPSSAVPNLTGTGTTNFIPVWTSATALGSSKLYQTAAGNVGLGTNAPTAKFEAVVTTATGTAVLGSATSTTGVNYGTYGASSSTTGVGALGTATAASGSTYGVYGSVASPTGIGVYGTATSGTGVAGGTSGATGYGVYGANAATTGNAFGVFGTTASPAGYAVYGVNTATTGNGYGVFGTSASTAGVGVVGSETATSGTTYGVYGSSLSPTGVAVYGTASSGTGVAGNTASGSGNGVYGANTATSGNAFGVYGTTASPTGYAVRGVATATSGANFGVYGGSLSPGGVGVAASSTGGGTALSATAQGGGLAGKFSGNVQITGNLAVSGTVSKGGGSFRIDHPLDPEHKYLYHSFVESPDMMNIYNGVVTLSRHGDAVVKLPEWFDALNRDFRYQLTCIGGFAPVYVAREVTGNEFKIGGGRPGMKVSWQVTGIRKDAFANEHRIPVEENKSSLE